MVINKVELTEVFPKFDRQRRRDEPLILEPIFCAGIGDLQKELHRMNFAYRKALVLELANTAAMVTELLPQAPSIRRGRR